MTAALQCAGNRRADLQAVRRTSGDPWAAGAIGNANWTGVALADVLDAAGVAADAGLHVAFEACDQIELPGEGRFRFGVSIPLTKARHGDVVLAHSMNGRPLTPEHGYPLRAVVPGFAGVRSAKWLAAVVVRDAPSDNPMQQRDYRLAPPDATEATVDWPSALTVNEMPLTAAICEPSAGAVLPPGVVTARGYALATGRAVARVDVSPDGGQTWRQARLEHDAAAPWGWTLWTVTLDLPCGRHELVVRAWDSAGQTQPARPDEVWNFKGYLCASWHRVKVMVC